MRNKSATEILLAMLGGHFPGDVEGPKLFLPVVDGRVLPDFPLEIIRRREHHPVPILIGNVADETAEIWRLDLKGINSEEKHRNTVRTNYGDHLVTQLLRLYPYNPNPKKSHQAYDTISADRWFVCPAQRLAQAVSVSQQEFVGRFFYTNPEDDFGAS